KTGHQGRAGEAQVARRMRPRRPARGPMRGVKSDSIFVMTSRGADGPARRSSSVSRGVVDRATANSLAADRHGPPQDDQAAKTRLFTAIRLQIPGRAWANMSPRLKKPAAWTAPHSGSAGSRVGWTSLPHAPNAAHFHGNTRSGR